MWVILSYPPGTLRSLLAHYNKPMPPHVSSNGPERDELITALLTCRQRNPSQRTGDLLADVQAIMLDCARPGAQGCGKEHINAVAVLVKHKLMSLDNVTPEIRMRIEEQLADYCKRLEVPFKKELSLLQKTQCLRVINRFVQSDPDVITSKTITEKWKDPKTGEEVKSDRFIPADEYLKHAMCFGARSGETLEEILVFAEYGIPPFGQSHSGPASQAEKQSLADLFHCLMKEAADGMSSCAASWKADGQSGTPEERFANWASRFAHLYGENAGPKCSALHLVAMAGAANAVPALIKSGADINARDMHDHTPLMLAIEENSLETVKALVKAGAKVNAISFKDAKEGRPCAPYDMAVKNGNQEIVEFLRNAGAAESQVFFERMARLQEKIPLMRI